MVGSKCVACGAVAAEDRCLQCGTAIRAGAYTVIRVLAQSQHSRMYLAEDPADRRVALKELIFAAVPGAAELDAFSREARLL